VLISMILLARQDAAAQVQFPKVARSFSAWLVRAFDPCTPGGLAVTSPQLPSAGCLTSASVVDDQMTIDFGKELARSGVVREFLTMCGLSA
jgi:hypothetical protein